jgi:hypothetical protein
MAGVAGADIYAEHGMLTDGSRTFSAYRSAFPISLIGNQIADYFFSGIAQIALSYARRSAIMVLSGRYLFLLLAAGSGWPYSLWVPENVSPCATWEHPRTRPLSRPQRRPRLPAAGTRVHLGIPQARRRPGGPDHFDADTLVHSRAGTGEITGRTRGDRVRRPGSPGHPPGRRCPGPPAGGPASCGDSRPRPPRCRLASATTNWPPGSPGATWSRRASWRRS